MTRRSRAALEARIAELRDDVDRLVVGLQPARATTSPAIERATLRLLGVHGLDANGSPLAAAVVERFSQAGPDRFGGEVALLLAVAARGHDVGAQEAALEVAAGRVDLAAEAQLLQDSERRAAAEQQLARWTAAAYQRIDANRTARHELSDALGVGDAPWLGARLGSFGLADAARECREFVAAGVDVLIVRVPRGRESVMTTAEPGDERFPVEMEPPPAGSQRGLAGLRAVLDESAAERGAYVFLATMSDGLAAAEQAVVAGFERADFLFLDPFDDIALGVAPEQALANHAAAHRLIARGGAILVLGPGPLLAGRELARGETLSARTRIGRSIAAQAVSIAWARASGVAADQVMIQVPFELPTWPGEAPLLLAELTVRRMLHPDQGLVVGEPVDSPSESWRLALPLCLLAGGDARLVIQRGRPAELRVRAEDVRVGAALARVLGKVVRRETRRDALPFTDDVTAVAQDLVEVAAETLSAAEAEGWASLVGGP